jgi:hypothetical protein
MVFHFNAGMSTAEVNGLINQVLTEKEMKKTN